MSRITITVTIEDEEARGPLPSLRIATAPPVRLSPPNESPYRQQQPVVTPISWSTGQTLAVKCPLDRP